MTSKALHALLDRGFVRTKANVFLQVLDLLLVLELFSLFPSQARESKSKRPPPPVIRAMRFIPKSDLSKVGLNMCLKDQGSNVKHIVAIRLT